MKVNSVQVPGKPWLRTDAAVERAAETNRYWLAENSGTKQERQRAIDALRRGGYDTDGYPIGYRGSRRH